MTSLTRLKFLLLTLGLFGLAIHARGAAGGIGNVVPGGTGTGTGVSGGSPAVSKFYVWDDFEGSALFTPFFARKVLNIPDQQSSNQFKWYFTDGGTGGTNAFEMAGGSIGWNKNLIAGTSVPGPGGGYGVHVFCSNSIGFGRIGGELSYTNDASLPNGFITSAVAILGPAGLMTTGNSPSGDFLHCIMNYDSVTIQRGAAVEDLLRGFFPSTFPASFKVPFDVQVVSNSIFAQFGPYFFQGTYSNLFQFAGSGISVIADFEMFGSVSNQIQWRWESFYAGPPEAWAISLARNNSTNFNPGERIIFKPTLTTNTYLSGPDESVIGMGSPSSATTTVTNELPPLSAIPGRKFTVFDAVNTAAGSNVWIVAKNQKINGGPDRTNITANGGSMALISTPTGWQILSTSP